MWRPLVRQVNVKNAVLNIYRRDVQLIMAICHNCKLKGHYRKQCPKAVNVVNVEPNVFCGVVKTAEKFVQISTVSDKKWTRPLNINGSILPVKIDTGAGADLMNYNDFLSLKNRPRLKHSNVLLSDYNGNTIKVK